MGRTKGSDARTLKARQVGYCLKNLHDGTRLRRSSLVELPVVKRIAAERYRNGYWGTANALRDYLMDVVGRLDTGEMGDAKSARVLGFLRMYVSETAVAKIARTLGVHRATVYRFIMPEAFELVADELERDSTRHAAT